MLTKEKIKKWAKRFPHLARFAAIGIALLALIFFFTGSRYDYLETVLANSFPSNEIILAKVVSVAETQQSPANTPGWLDTIQAQIMTGEARGETVTIHNQGTNISATTDAAIKVKPGETVVLAKNHDYQGDPYYMADRYRLPSLLFFTLLFVIAVMVFGGIRGLTSLVGLGATIAVLMLYVVPQILAGGNALVVAVIGAVVIAVVSLYLAHGVNKRTTVAVAGTLITLALAVGLTVALTSSANLLGIGSEESAYLSIDVAGINLRGLLLAGIIIGMLGVLDDVTIGQSSAVEELHDANPALDFKELYRRATNIGREHIASLVNTLFLAYVGVSFPLFLLLIVQHAQVPLWLAVNGEPIAEEVVRTLVGSLALVAAVPITTLLAAWWFGKKRNSDGKQKPSF